MLSLKSVSKTSFTWQDNEINTAYLNKISDALLWSMLAIELGGVSELKDRRGCAILALKVVTQKIIFA